MIRCLWYWSPLSEVLYWSPLIWLPSPSTSPQATFQVRHTLMAKRSLGVWIKDKVIISWSSVELITSWSSDDHQVVIWSDVHLVMCRWTCEGRAPLRTAASLVGTFALTKYDQWKWKHEWDTMIPIRVGDGAVQDGSQHSPVHQAPGLRSKMYLM